MVKLTGKRRISNNNPRNGDNNMLCLTLQALWVNLSNVNNDDNNDDNNNKHDITTTTDSLRLPSASLINKNNSINVSCIHK